MMNKSEIMKNAWKLFRAMEITFSEALHMAWENAKNIAKALVGVVEECHTWFGWTQLGYEVIHNEKALLKVTVHDAKTKAHTRVLSYFGKSQVCVLGTQAPKAE